MPSARVSLKEAQACPYPGTDRGRAEANCGSSHSATWKVFTIKGLRAMYWSVFLARQLRLYTAERNLQRVKEALWNG